MTSGHSALGPVQREVGQRNPQLSFLSTPRLLPRGRSHRLTFSDIETNPHLPRRTILRRFENPGKRFHTIHVTHDNRRVSSGRRRSGEVLGKGSQRLWVQWRKTPAVLA